MEAVAESSPRSSTLPPPPPEGAAKGTRTLQRFDLARKLAAAREPASSPASKATRTATKRMVAFDRIRRLPLPVPKAPAMPTFDDAVAPPTAGAAPPADDQVAWALAASVTLVAAASVASAATYLLLFPRV